MMSRTAKGLFLGLIVAVGCAPPEGAAPSASNVKFEPLTDAAPDALALHLERMTQQYSAVVPETPTEAKALLKSYADAMLQTAEELAKRTDAGTETRKIAMQAVFETLDRMRANKLADVDSLLAACDRLEAASPDSEISTAAAFQRTQILATAMLEAPDEKAREERYAQLMDATMKLGKAKPVHESASSVLNRMAMEAVHKKDFTRARELYQLLADAFSKDQFGKYAPGAIHRLDLLGQPLVDFKGKDLFGEADRSVDALRGKVILVDYWATWCEPCLAEMPRLAELRRKYKEQGFEILGVCMGRSALEAQQYVTNNGYDWPHIVDPGPNGEFAETPLAINYGVAMIPFKLVVDREGRLIASGHSLQEVLADLEKAIMQPAQTGQLKPAGTDRSVEGS
jgi:thiol-disulfide isomerase/thioredoxin